MSENRGDKKENIHEQSRVPFLPSVSDLDLGPLHIVDRTLFFNLLEEVLEDLLRLEIPLEYLKLNVVAISFTALEIRALSLGAIINFAVHSPSYFE